MSRPRIVLATRELYPFAQGGIAPITAALAESLSAVADVVLVTTVAHEPAYRALRVPEPFGAGTEVIFADDPGEFGGRGHAGWVQAWSASLHRAIQRRFQDDPRGGPDVIEFPDYLGEGLITLQARRTGDPLLADTTIAVRVHTSAEMVSVLNGRLDPGFDASVVTECERYTLRHADVLLHSGGDVRGTYERFYPQGALAPFRRIPEAFHVDFTAAGDPAPRAGDDDVVRLLFLGRLERRKGVHRLMQALRAVPQLNWQLTLVGEDTDTAPLATSMRARLQLSAGANPRVRFVDRVERREIGAIIEAHDIVCVPSLWECWPNVAREAFHHGRPVLATPVGGLREMVEHDVSGWLARDTGVQALADLLEQLLTDVPRVRRVVEGDGPRAALERLQVPDETRAGYLALAGGEARRRPPLRLRSAAPPTVTVVVPYYRMEAHIEETLASVRAQTHPALEVIVVNDGSLRDEDRGLYDLEGVTVITQPNRGLGSARTLGALMAQGRYVLPLDPDNTLEPEFLERTVRALEHDADLAYATSWSRYMDVDSELLDLPAGGYTPLGNWSRLVDVGNVAGDGTALLRREVLDLGHWWDVELTSYEDWFHFRELHHAGLFGDVVPERLFRYRVRPDSMLRTVGLRQEAVLHAEMHARTIERSVPWMPKSA